MDCRVTQKELLPGIFQWTDRMGMHMTLLTGQKRALLIDTGYGFDDLRQAAARATALPLTVLCTHGHHDHACGNFQFDSVLLVPADFAVCETYAGGWRERVWGQAVDKNLDLNDWKKDDFVHAGCGQCAPLAEEDIDLGGLTARVLSAPGHTPGSAVVYVPERKLLVTGDDWNLTTWLFFPEAEGMATFRASFDRMLSLDFDFALCSHAEGLYPRQAMLDFRAGIAPNSLRAGSVPAPGMLAGKRVMQCHPASGQTFCYDFDKLPPKERA